MHQVAGALKFVGTRAGRDDVVPPSEGLWRAGSMSAFTADRLGDLRSAVVGDGPNVQTLHVGPFDDEGHVLARMQGESLFPDFAGEASDDPEAAGSVESVSSPTCPTNPSGPTDPPGPAGSAGPEETPDLAASPVRLTAWVHGHVQGVGFRWATRTKALTLGLVGFASNYPDGRVLVVAEGREDATGRLLDWLNSGETPGRVDLVVDAVTGPRGGYHGFESR